MKPYTIEKARLPFPQRGDRSLFYSSVSKMEVGDCYIVSMKQRDVATRANAVAKRIGNGHKFTTQKQSPNSTALWRTA